MDMSCFDEDQLLEMAADLNFSENISETDQLATRFNSDLQLQGMGFGARDYWRALKAEMQVLICGPRGDDKDPYVDLRATMKRHSSKSTVAIVSGIAVFVGARIGVEAAVLVPWIAIFFTIVLRVGVEAFCRLASNV